MRPTTRSQTIAKNGDGEHPKKDIVKPVQAKASHTKSNANESTRQTQHALGVGDKLPDQTVLTDDNEEVSILELSQRSSMIIFMYPKANTPGCTKQACGFRDEFSRFESLGYCVYGLSADSPKAQSSWKKKYDFPYQLLSDPDRTLIKKFGAFKAPNSTRRSHVIVEKGGIIQVIELDISPLVSLERALAFVSSQHEQ